MNYIRGALLIIFPLLIFMSTHQDAFPETSSAVWGRIIYTETPVYGLSHQYFIYFEKGLESQAYPIETNNKNHIEMIKKISIIKSELKGM